MEILPLCAFPSWHWCRLASFPNSIIDAFEHYPKQTFRNRYQLLGANGVVLLTVPVVSQKGKKIPINEIRIFGNSWRNNHSRTIISAYGRAAFFEHYIDDVQAILFGNQKTLFEFNLDAVQFIKKQYSQLNIAISQSHIQTDNGTDWRDKFEPINTWPHTPTYPQVFSDRFGFVENLSILDVLFNIGPMAQDYEHRF